MSRINIMGRTPNGGPNRPTSNPDYDRALGQVKSEATGDNRAWLRQQAYEAAQQRKLDQLTAREMRERDQEVRLLEARNKEARRLQHRLSLLESRAAGTYTPSTWHATKRAIGTLDLQASEFRRKYGISPFSNAAVPNMVHGMSDESTMFKTGRTLRIGNIAQRQAFQREWGGLNTSQAELKRIERTLKTMESTLKRTGEFERNPVAQASLIRQRDALYVAKARVEAGLSANSRMRNAWGKGVGLFSAALHNPVVDGVLAGGMFTVGLPYATNKLYADILGMGKPYRDFSINAMRMGLAGGFSGTRLRNALLRPGSGSLANLANNLGSGLPAQLAAFGLSQHEVLKFGTDYGVPFRSARDAVRFAERARMMSLAPGMNLSESALSQMAGQTQTVFGMKPVQFWQKLLNVQRTASREGMDSSRVAQGFQQLLGAAASSGGTVSIGGLGRWYSRMLASGSPLMRNGGAAAYVTGMNNTLDQVGMGGALPATLMLSSFFGRMGDPATGPALQRAFGASNQQWAEMTSGVGKLELRGYLAATRAGNAPLAAQYAAQLLKGHPRLWNHVITKSGFGGYGPAVEPLIRSNVTGVPLSVELGREAAPAKAPVSSRFGPAIPVQDMLLLMQESKRTGIPLHVLMAVAATENAQFDPRAVSSAGAIGLMQVLPSTGAEYGYGDPRKLRTAAYNIRAGGSAFLSRLQEAGGDPIKAWELYNGASYSAVMNGGPLPRQTRLGAARMRKYLKQYGDLTNALGLQNINADQSSADLNASRYANNLAQPLTDTLTDAVKIAADGLKGLGDVVSTVTGDFERLHNQMQQHVNQLHHLQQKAHPGYHPVTPPWAYGAMGSPLSNPMMGQQYSTPK